MPASAQPGGGRVHLDSASGLPLHPVARTTYLEALDHGWADPLRLHHEGRTARLLLDNAREVIAEIFRCRPDEVSFVPSGTTACHLAVLGLSKGRSRSGSAVVHSAVEHSAILHAAGWGDAAEPVPVAVDAFGRVDLEAWREAVAAPGVAMACLQAANHEVGTLQPLEAADAACKDAGVPLVVDAAAATGWVELPNSGDVITASAHKWGGPGGIGVLVIRSGTRWRNPSPTDERETAFAGYVSVPAALAAAAALQAVESERAQTEPQLRTLTDQLRRGIAAEIADVDLAGHPSECLPHIVNFSCLYVDGEALVTELDRLGFAVSSGSACTSSALEPSHVLAAMGVLTHGNVRVSIRPGTTRDDLDRFIAATSGVVRDLRHDQSTEA